MMPRRPAYTPTRNPMANRRGFLAFVVRQLEFQTYFDPTTMTTFGLGQSDESVTIRSYPEGRVPYDLKRETARVERERQMRRNRLRRRMNQ